MARHILQGERPTFFYGQAYMGSLDAFLVALGFRLFGQTVMAIRIVQASLYLLIVATGFIIAWKISANRVTAGIITAALILGASLLGRGDASNELFGYPALSIILFGIAAVAGAWLLYSTLRHDLPQRRTAGWGFRRGAGG